MTKRERLPRKMKKCFKKMLLFFTIRGNEYKEEQEARKNANN